MNPPLTCLLNLTLIFLVILTTHFGPVTSQSDDRYICLNNGNYTRESSYRADLNSLLRSLSSNIGDSGFYSTSVGQVNAIALCRGDIQPDDCRRCIYNVTVDILQSCPNQMQAIMWSEFCMLRYSNEFISGTLEISPARYVWNLPRNNVTSDVDGFKRVRRELINNQTERAANGGAMRKVAAHVATVGNNIIFALVQCTPDLSAENCASCLVSAAENITTCCDDAVAGVSIYMPSCQLRYDSYAFFNITRLVEILEPASSGNSNDNTTRDLIIIVISTVVGLTLALYVGIFTIKRLKRKTKGNTDIDEIAVESIQYDFGQIRAATNDFSEANKLGHGGFGTVYRGKLGDGREIAAKRLSKNSGQGDLEFKNEVLLVARLQHRNLVKLLGFSIEGSERLLIYEFHQNGSLDHFIFDPIKSSNLDWEVRSKIIGGIAKGLLYLHEDSRLRIIHRDLKASNVLLDVEMNPKISDFGMAKLIMPNVTQESSRIVGTYGYIAPEYAIHGQFSIKSDVYSFGVLALEIISGQKKLYFQNGDNSKDLLSFAWRSWREESTANLIDPILRASSGSQLDILKCIHIALLCVQKNADDRPTMASVVQMLNSCSLSLPVPLEPAFYVPSSLSKDASLQDSSSSKNGQAQYGNLSNKDFSITVLCPR